jgi:ABC-type nitrate/sulfonate/bicarbonate transport system ATPase subunit
MDEPLSNLDAKLRVQMRAEVAPIQRHLGVGTIYVTHDPVEAMTVGERVSVMRSGRSAVDLVLPGTGGFAGSRTRSACPPRVRSPGRSEDARGRPIPVPGAGAH